MRRPEGTLVPDGELATITFRRTYPHTQQHVWDAIATPEGLRAWLLCTRAELDGRVGGRIELVSGPAQYHSVGQILAWEPPQLLEYEWNVAPVPEMPRGERAIFRFELRADGGSTHLRVEYRRITLQTARGFLPGLHAYLDRLEAQLDGRPLVDWLPRFRELLAEYPQWSHHAPTAGQ
jgi:uncharacterized protein YndB with AHSA1/START domain